MRSASATLLFCSALGLAALGACSSGDHHGTQGATQTLVACDPSAPVYVPTTLGHVLAVGESADGTFYVATDDTDSPRVFISNGNVLQRVRVLGSGQSPEGDTLSFESEPPTRLVIGLSSGTVSGIALAPDDDKTFFDQLPASATQLVVKDAKDVAGFAVRNLPGDVEIETVASIEGGAELVITRPRDDWSYDDFHLFYGTGGALQERVIIMPDAMPRSHRLFNFDVDGETYTVSIASPLLSPGVASTVVTPTGELALTLQDASAGLPAGAHFTCLQ